VFIIDCKRSGAIDAFGFVICYMQGYFVRRYYNIIAILQIVGKEFIVLFFGYGSGFCQIVPQGVDRVELYEEKVLDQL
jgi:hypothetical protein